MTYRINRDKFSKIDLKAGLDFTPHQIADLYDLEYPDVNHAEWGMIEVQFRKLLEDSFCSRYGYLPSIKSKKRTIRIATGDETPQNVSQAVNVHLSGLKKQGKVASGTAQHAEMNASGRRHLTDQAAVISQIVASASRKDRRVFSSTAASQYEIAKAKMKPKD